MNNFDTWNYEKVNGFEMWTATPEGGTQYLVIHDGTGEYTAYFSIGTAHKFTRPIDGAFLNLDAAKAACFNHSKPA